MKKIILTIFIIFLNIASVNAIEDKKIISDSERQSELLNSFNEVNQYSENLFSQRNTVQKVVEKRREQRVYGEEETYDVNSFVHIPKTLTPIKRLRLHLKEKRSVKDLKREHEAEALENTVSSAEQAILDCDNMEYFTERNELEATGNVSLRFPQNDAVLKSDRMIYNQITNEIKAIGNVNLIKGGVTMEGDYLVVNMNEENAIMENPQVDFAQISAHSKNGYVHGDDVIQEQGSLYIDKKTILYFDEVGFGPDLKRMNIPEEQRSSLISDDFGEKLKLKVNDIILNSKKEHDNITIKKAEILYRDKKVGVIPAMTLHMNKKRDYYLVDIPEIGTLIDLGMYAGPGFVFDTPHGTALKFIPFLNYHSSGDKGSSLGVGGFLRYRAATNETDIAYGTTSSKLLVKGIQYLDDNLYIQYGANRFIDDWFMGYRKAKLMTELVYHTATLHKDFLGNNKDMTFSQRLTAGYVHDGPDNTNGLGILGEGNLGTFRSKYMAEVIQTIFKLNSETTNPVNMRFDIIGQGSFGVYGTGDTQAVVRIGPRIHHQYKRWMSDIGYFLSGDHDETPLYSYDRYVYGKSNLYFRESLRLSKYLTLSWLSSINFSYKDEKYRYYKGMGLFPENAFFLAIGPDDCRFHIGYDVVRQQTFLNMTMNLDAKGTTIDYDKIIVKNPDNLQSKPKEILYVRNIPESTRNKYGANETVEKSEIEKAPVTDIIYDERL